MERIFQLIFIFAFTTNGLYSLKFAKIKYHAVVTNKIFHSSLQDDTLPTNPKWAAGGPLSDFVNLLISIKPIYSLMKIGARRKMISTAEANGIEWSKIAQDLDDKKDFLINNYNSLVVNNIDYPEYYTQNFHAYESGNLNWLAAYECESATMSVALRVWPNEILTAKMAQRRMRNSYLDAVKAYISKNSHTNPLKSIVDIGCSVGVSTFYLADAFHQAKNIYGFDLSPYFLAVAKLRQSNRDWITGDFKEARLDRISWVHGKAEQTDFQTNEMDLVSVSFLLHELPQAPSNNIFKELYRITKPGGVISLTDNNPRSPVIQNLPPILFTLMKSTEPWSDEYYVYDVERALEATGFINIETLSTDPRHRTIVAMKPVK